MSDNQGKMLDVGIFRKVLTFTKPYLRTFYFVTIAAILLSGFAVLGPVLLKITVDDYITTKDITGLLVMVGLMLATLLAEVFFQFSFTYYANWLGQQVIKDIRIKTFNHMLSFKMAYFNKSAVGRLVTRTVSDMESIASIFSEGLFSILADLLKMLLVSIVMLVVDWKLTLISFAVMPIVLYATRLFQKAMKVAFEEVRTQVANLNTFVQERLTGMKIVQLFSAENREYDKFVEINEKHKKAWLKTVWYNSVFFPVAELTGAIAVGLVVWYGGLQAATNNDTAILGTVFMFIQMTPMLFRPLRQIADKFNTFQMGMVAANRVFGVLETQSHISDSGTLEAFNLKGNLQFLDVHFSYKTDEEVLHGISFEVKAGQTIALVGATGAGKSTIINLLSRFYDINSGHILIDGHDIREYSLKSLRANIAIVLQDVFLFADTIMNNITLHNPDVTENEVKEAAKKIGVHEFIESLPDGYYYNVKERGVMLSSGQRQLIAFLRAYVSKPSILILDEATSSVDSYSEHLIQQATEKVTQGRTSLVIAHRLATIKKADLIMVMDKGHIVEQGKHAQLLKKKDGYYRNLYEAQFLQEEAAV